jgi:hypothetical protein
MSGTSIDLNADAGPTIITFAHYGANYLFTESRTIIGAWGSDTQGSLNGPLQASGQTQYLYWDVNLATGQLSRGWTLVPPLSGPFEPANPLPDTHWYDTTLNRMRVYRKPSPTASGAWQDKIRIFAAVYNSGANIVPYPIGSQVGINTGAHLSGNLILGINNRPLKQADGTFAHTESPLIIYQTSSHNVKFSMAYMTAQAIENIPKFYLVSLVPNRRMALARSSNLYQFVSGISISDLYSDEVGEIVTNGVVANNHWHWAQDEINMPLFCGPTGQVTLTPPAAGTLQQIGFVYDTDAIYMNLFPPVRVR